MLDNLNIDTVIFAGFLIVNFAVGLYYGRGVKDIVDYALGGRNFSTGALVATIVATCSTSSRFFTTLSKIYSDGLQYVFMTMTMALSRYLLGAFFSAKNGGLGKISVAEVMQYSPQ